MTRAFANLERERAFHVHPFLVPRSFSRAPILLTSYAITLRVLTSR